MNYLKPLLALSILLSFAATTHAVTVKSNHYRNQALFGIRVKDDTTAFFCKEAAVRSISLQKYITNGFKVHELNIATDGNGLLRIYHSRPLDPGELAETMRKATMQASSGNAGSPAMPEGVNALVDRATQTYDVLTDTVIIKEYPNATHAHTIELRTRSRDELLELFEELEKHWLQQNEAQQDNTTDTDTNTVRTGRKRLGGTLFIMEQ